MKMGDIFDMGAALSLDNEKKFDLFREKVVEAYKESGDMETAVSEAKKGEKLSEKKLTELAEKRVDDTFDSFVFWSVIVTLITTIILLIVTFLIMAYPVNPALGSWTNNNYAVLSAFLILCGLVMIVIFGGWYIFYKRDAFAFDKRLAMYVSAN